MAFRNGKRLACLSNRCRSITRLLADVRCRSLATIIHTVPNSQLTAKATELGVPRSEPIELSPVSPPERLTQNSSQTSLTP